MSRKSTIKLLLINESDNEGERLISLFRNAGRIARAHRATSAENLHKELENNRWDLIIANDNHPEIDVDQCLEQLKKLKNNIPAIVIRNQDAQSALDAGASDVIAENDDQRLIFAAFRELNHLEMHRKLDQVLAKLTEAEGRCNLLMAQSQDAIAYCGDGMIISANPLFCTRFGYDDPDDLDCLPIIDLIASSNHEKIKHLLKLQTTNTDQSNTTGAEFEFTGVTQDGDTFAATMQLSNAVVDDEPCIQLSVRDPRARSADHNGSGTNSSATNSNDNVTGAETEPTTGLLSHDHFLSQLRNTAQQAASGDSTSVLLFIGIDRFTAFRSKWGITHAHKAVLDIARFVQQETSVANSLAHFCDDSFTLLLPETGTEKALTFAQSLCKKLEDHIIEIGNQSIQCTISIGLVALNKHCEQDPNILVEQAFSCCEQVRQQTNNEGIGNGAMVYVPVRHTKALGDAQGDEDLNRTLEEALEDGRVVLTYQPVVSLRGTNGDHYEVQAKMINENGEEEQPEQFLKSLKFNNPNTRLDRWIIIESTKQLAAQHSSRHETRLFIHLTSNALLDETIIPWLSVALKAGGINPETLIFQFSEADVSHYLKPAKLFAEAIQDLGCRFCIAEFGQTGDSNKALKHIKADFAKIAGSFTHELQDTGDTQVLQTMVSKINENKTQAIISSVENASALAVLWQLGVDYIQGNYLATPARDMNYEFTDIA